MYQEFVQSIKDLIRKEIDDVHTAFPASIVSFDSNTGLAAVKPEVKFKAPNGIFIDYPLICGVPVLFPQSSGNVIAFPINENDGCLVIVSEKSLDNWLFNKHTDTDLKFDLTNAVCIPGLFSTSNDFVRKACENGSVVIGAGSNFVEIRPSKVIVDSNLEVNGVITSQGGSSGGSVRYDISQSLTSAEKNRVRENIGLTDAFINGLIDAKLNALNGNGVAY